MSRSSRSRRTTDEPPVVARLPRLRAVYLTELGLVVGAVTAAVVATLRRGELTMDVVVGTMVAIALAALLGSVIHEVLLTADDRLIARAPLRRDKVVEVTDVLAVRWSPARLAVVIEHRRSGKMADPPTVDHGSGELDAATGPAHADGARQSDADGAAEPAANDAARSPGRDHPGLPPTPAAVSDADAEVAPARRWRRPEREADPEVLALSWRLVGVERVVLELQRRQPELPATLPLHIRRRLDVPR